MNLEANQIRREIDHPSPCCIQCRKPFGVKKLSGWDDLESCFSQEVEPHCLCLGCMKNKSQDLRERFVASLTNEQRQIFIELNELEASISSCVILDR